MNIISHLNVIQKKLLLVKIIADARDRICKIIKFYSYENFNLYSNNNISKNISTSHLICVKKDITFWRFLSHVHCGLIITILTRSYISQCVRENSSGMACVHLPLSINASATSRYKSPTSSGFSIIKGLRTYKQHKNRNSLLLWL